MGHVLRNLISHPLHPRPSPDTLCSIERLESGSTSTQILFLQSFPPFLQPIWHILFHLLPPDHLLPLKQDKDMTRKE